MSLFSLKSSIFVFVFFSHFGCSLIFAQTNNTTNLQTWIIQTFPEAGLDKETLFVIDGVPISQEKLQQKLSKYSLDELSAIAYLDEKAKANLGCRPIDNLVLITTNHEGSRKLLKENYKIAKKLFTERSDPALMINGEIIDPSEIRSLIKELKFSQIINITIVNQPVSSDYYGENGSNGLVIIVIK